ncbi:hypothetical protein C8R44DRAFT_751574 [Mycena epipterygia]|nr:hypothetical protein C8R44DRAFT_751574 [Mycena epipterygia]
MRWDSKLRLGAHCKTYLSLAVIWHWRPSEAGITFLFIRLSANLKESPKAAYGYCGDVCLRFAGVPGNTGLLSSVSERLNGIKSGYFRHRSYIDFTLPTLVKMKFTNKASSLESCADVAPHTFQLVVMLFVAVAAAVPTEMLKREPSLKCPIAPANRISGTLCLWEQPLIQVPIPRLPRRSLESADLQNHRHPVAEIFFKLAAGAQKL